MDEVASKPFWVPSKKKQNRRAQKTLRGNPKKHKCSKSEKILPLEKQNEKQETLRSSLPKLHLVKYKVQLANSKLHTSLPEAIHLLEQLDDNSLKIRFLWPSVMEATRLLEEQIINLNQQLRANQAELMEMKRKRWCYMCEEEATYMRKINSEQYFYCSKSCENDRRLQSESIP